MSVRFKRVENIIGIVDGYYPVNKLEEQPKEINVKETNRESGKETVKKGRKKEKCLKR